MVLFFYYMYNLFILVAGEEIAEYLKCRLKPQDKGNSYLKACVSYEL